MLYMAVLSLAVYLVVLGLGYVWARAMHYPFTLRQRKMWTYYVLVTSSFPILGPLMVAMGLWILPVRGAVEVIVVLLIVWMVVAFYMVCRMSRAGGRLSKEQQQLG